MHWSLREFFAFGDGSGAAFLWDAELTPVAGRKTAEISGMDLVLLRGERLSRNEVYFDRMALFGAPTGVPTWDWTHPKSGATISAVTIGFPIGAHTGPSADRSPSVIGVGGRHRRSPPGGGARACLVQPPEGRR